MKALIQYWYLECRTYDMELIKSNPVVQLFCEHHLSLHLYSDLHLDLKRGAICSPTGVHIEAVMVDPFKRW